VKDRIKNILQKKWKEEIASQLGAHRHTQEKIEKIFFGFCDFVIFFEFFGLFLQYVA
jgi:hypothetical protein